MSLKETDPAVMSSLSRCPRSQVKRAAKRASYGRSEAYALIDRLKTAHVGFVEEGEPRIIPLTA